MKTPTITGHEAIFEFAPEQCPVCGTKLIKTRACSGLADEGWETMLRCIRLGCNYRLGIEKKGGKENED